MNNNYDFVATDGNYLSIHSGMSGKKSIALPEKVRKVYDVFKEKVIAENVDKIEVDIDDNETAIFKLEY